MSSSPSSSSVPVPFVVAPTGDWDGDDGKWSTFSVDVGTPPQTFRVFPSTIGEETWVPIPAGCSGIVANVSNCGDLRGVDTFNGIASQGFQQNASSSWKTIGIYELTLEQDLSGSSDAGLYGLDTIALITANGVSGPSLSGQTVAGIATADFWLGSLGLGTRPGNFSVLGNETVPSLLSSMKTQGAIPSLSYGYTAGAVYSTNSIPGSLTLGGYDQARFTPSNISFSIGADSNQTLPVGVQSIVGINTLGGTLSLLPGGTGIIAPIDSTVSHLWLPQTVCDVFEQAFGLTYDPITDLYLVNSTIHSQLLQLNPSVTFAIGNNATGGSTTDIVLPYAAFDLNASLPIYNISTPYFPLRRAANASQYALGRTLLQEAYITVDWERDEFTIGQAISQNSTKDIVPILPPSQSNGPTKSTLGTGAIAGIAVGIAALLVAVGVLLFIFWRRKRKTKITADEAQNADRASERFSDYPEDRKPAELASASVLELPGQSVNYELMSTSVMELQGHSVEQELGGREKKPIEIGMSRKEKSDPAEEVHELP